MLREHRRFQRTIITLPFVFCTQKKICEGVTRNMSLSSMLAHVDVGDPSIFTPYEMGHCQLSYGKDSIILRGQVMRTLGNDLALRLINLKREQEIVLASIFEKAMGTSGVALHTA